jgi:prepilin-type processing-associated H-X9-DG protein
MKVWMCPASPVVDDPDQASPTHFVGITGVGRDAAELPLSDKRAGLFGYDRKVTKDDVKDGLDTTAAVIEAIDGGPWTAGHATLRGVVPDGAPYFGEDGQFPSLHRRRWSKKPAMNVLFLDGSVRLLDSTTPNQVFEAHATIAGGD